MSSDFIPTPVVQAEYVQPSDGDLKPVASVTPFLQGLADGAKATPTIPFNWIAAATPDNLQRGWFSVKDQAWYAVGATGSDYLDVSFNGGLSWVSLTGGLGSSLPCQDIAFDLNGNGVILTTGNSPYAGTWSAYGTVTWAVQAAALHHTVAAGRITWDPIHNLFVAVYRTGSSGIVLETSPTGVTWTNHTSALPASWTGYTGTAAAPKIFYANGVLVACFLDNTGAGTYRVIRSTDGGTTWTDVFDQANVLPHAALELSLAYDPAYGVWFMSASTTTTARGSALFISTNNGVTWIPTAGNAALVVADCALQDIAVICGLLVGVNDDGRIFWTPDQGVTWWFAVTNTITSSALPGMRVGDGQLMVWNPADKTAYPSTRHGAVGLQVV